MLTDSEREWLNDREIFLAGLGCYVWDGYYWDEGSPFEDMKEAVEFEARVAVKLTELADWIAQGIGTDMECIDLCYASDICEDAEDMPCKWCFLKWARLQVEEEMDADR